ncbi:hypothetical protein GCM10009604_23420 [Corynebacterium aurimucosum]
MQEGTGIGARHRDDAAMGAVDDGGTCLYRALLHKGVSIVPGDPGDIDKRAALELSSSGPGKKWRRVTHALRW